MESSALPSEFMPILRQALKAPAQPSLKNVPLHAMEEFSPEDSKRFKPIIDGIHFNMRFILSYQLVLIGLLLVFTVIHWGGRLRAWRRRRRQYSKKCQEQRKSPDRSLLEGKGARAVESRSLGSSSSSSTLEGDANPPHIALEEEQDEQTPLLLKTQPMKSSIRRRLLTSKIKACLTYQPRPIPIINKTLPSNGSSLAIIAFLGLQIFYLFFKTPLTLSMLFVSADRASILFVANLPLLYLFAAKNQPIKVLTGYSYESLNIIHRRLGEVMCLLALLHSVGMTGVWYTLLRYAGITLVHFLLIKMILLGIGAFVAYELIYLTSLGSFRQRWYELFLASHVVLQVVALVLVWFHHPRSRIYVGVTLAIFLIDRLACRMSSKITKLRASLDIQKDKQTVILHATLPLITHRSLLRTLFGKQDVTKGWKTTEHIFLTVPSLARKHIIQAHPFTIASPASSAEDQEASLELIIRAQDGFSGDLVRYAKAHDSVAVRLDGPYGSQSAVQMLRDSDHTVIVAGGSGVAVAWPLVWSILETEGSKDPEDGAKTTNKNRVVFVWIVREQSHLSWLGNEKLKELEDRGVVLVIPPPTAACGHPDLERIVGDWIACFDERSKVGVVASGPDGMNRTVRNTCASLIEQGRNVSVEIEKFGW